MARRRQVEHVLRAAPALAPKQATIPTPPTSAPAAPTQQQDYTTLESVFAKLGQGSPSKVLQAKTSAKEKTLDEAVRILREQPLELLDGPQMVAPSNVSPSWAIPNQPLMGPGVQPPNPLPIVLPGGSSTLAPSHLLSQHGAQAPPPHPSIPGLGAPPPYHGDQSTQMGAYLGSLPNRNRNINEHEQPGGDYEQRNRGYYGPPDDDYESRNRDYGYHGGEPEPRGRDPRARYQDGGRDVNEGGYYGYPEGAREQRDRGGRFWEQHDYDPRSRGGGYDRADDRPGDRDYRVYGRERERDRDYDRRSWDQLQPQQQSRYGGETRFDGRREHDGRGRGAYRQSGGYRDGPRGHRGDR